MFEAIDDAPEPPSPVIPLDSLDKKLEALDRDSQRLEWGVRSSANNSSASPAQNAWMTMRHVSAPTAGTGNGSVQFPTVKNTRVSGPGHRKLDERARQQPRPTIQAVAHGARHTKLSLRDTRGSPRDLDDPDFTHYRPVASGVFGRGGDSDSELEARGPRLRKKPNSYFDITPGNYHTWGYMGNNQRPSVIPAPKAKACIRGWRR